MAASVGESDLAAIMEQLKSMSIKMEKLDRIETTVLETQAQLSNLQESLEFTQADVANIKGDIKELQDNQKIMNTFKEDFAVM